VDVDRDGRFVGQVALIDDWLLARNQSLPLRRRLVHLRTRIRSKLISISN
jgi:hypothetical protein